MLTIFLINAIINKIIPPNALDIISFGRKHKILRSELTYISLWYFVFVIIANTDFSYINRKNSPFNFNNFFLHSVNER